ncbi:hypothetical protein [Robinsoniella sp. KNHs210]|uniref:hypothetical protein n=1 Tax=Robinsoniella sp. KNHs210 TaxID=1469950 RepID=UPI002E8DD307|nr:hypothetical protein [Robinsoniella sp. KNHs210]
MNYTVDIQVTEALRRADVIKNVVANKRRILVMAIIEEISAFLQKGRAKNVKA